MMKPYKIFYLFSVLLACSSQVEADDQKHSSSFSQNNQTLPIKKQVLSKKSTSQPQRSGVQFFAVGDVLPHIPVKESAERNNRLGPDGLSQNHEGYDTFFERAFFLFKKADINFANLEAPVAPENEILTRSLIFNAPVALLKSLQFHGFQIISFANNHVYDQGRKGFVESLTHFETEGMLAAGAGHTQEEAFAPKILEKGNVKICVMAISRLLNRDRQPKSKKAPQLALVPYGKEGNSAKRTLKKHVLKAQELCDFIVLSIHWGKEYTITPAKANVRFAHEFLELGVDAIIGHHPHVLQPIERYETKDGRQTFVAYSLGNFVSHQAREYPQKTKPPLIATTQDSMVLAFDIVQKETENGKKAVLGSLGFFPAFTDREATPYEKTEKTQEVIRGVLLDYEITEAKTAFDRLSSKEKLSSEEMQEKETWKSRLELFTERKNEIVKIVGEEFLLTLPEE